MRAKIGIKSEIATAIRPQNVNIAYKKTQSFEKCDNSLFHVVKLRIIAIFLELFSLFSVFCSFLLQFRKLNFVDKVNYITKNMSLYLHNNT